MTAGTRPASSSSDSVFSAHPFGPFTYTLRASVQTGPYKCNELSFRLQTVTGGAEPASNFTMDRRSITLKVGELKYLLLNMSTLVRHLGRLTMAEKDVSEYVHISIASSSFVAPKETVPFFVQYDVLFNEITGKL